MITQFYRNGVNTKVEVSLAPDKTIVPNTSFTINLFDNSETTDKKTFRRRYTWTKMFKIFE